VPRNIQRSALETCAAAAASGGPQHFTAETLSPGGPRSWWDVIVTPLSATRQPERLLVISRDISHQKIAEDQARWSAKHDSLTELPNRVLLQQELDLLTAARDADFAVLILDVDEFKNVNDTLGHDAGDALLCTFAERLRAVARPDDLVARLGGDEFGIILKGVRDEAEIRAVADRLFASLGEPCVYQGKIIDFHASIGASLFPRDGATKAELLKNADIALYAAKSSGRKNLKIFDSSMRFDGERQHLMIAAGRKALRENAILPYYQPKVELASGRIAGFEALLRWRDPGKGIQSPQTIMAAFDDLTLAAEISDRMIDCVIADVGDWLAKGLQFHHVAFNAGAAELRAVDFAERLLERLERAAIPTSCIQMEVTETVILGRGAEYLERTLRTLSEAGIRIALDDFGTGYASLSHLKDFPVDLLKIDRSFVRNLQANAEDAAIVDAVVGLGRSLRIDVIAEGIETRAQHDRLIGLGCRYGQGFLYSRPVAAARVAGLCAHGRWSGVAAAA
jgi:diguanylate cyclase (GGDEF)-like protein